MAFTPRSPAWANSPTTTTPLSATNLTDLETRVTNIGLAGTTAQTGSTYTAVAGDIVLANPASGNITVTLPSAATSTTVTVYAGAAISGTNQITVSRAGGATISGVGVAGTTSFLLGTAGAYAVLASDGTNWFIVSGQQDTGWLNLTLTGSVSGAGGTFYSPSSRQRGDEIRLKGAMLNGTGSTIASGSAWATLPTGITAPARTVLTAASESATSPPTTATTLAVSSAGAISVSVGVVNGGTVALDSVTYNTTNT